MRNRRRANQRQSATRRPDVPKQRMQNVLCAGSEERRRASSGLSQFIACAMAIVLAACRPAEAPPAPEIRPVRTITIEKRTDGGTVSLTGTVQAQTEANLAFRIDGKLTERYVNVGDVVRPGQ